MVEPHTKPQLESNFFKTQDPSVKARLDQCLAVDLQHITPGKRSLSTPEGKAVATLQDALRLIKEKLPLSALPDIKDASGDYGADTTAAVRAYKSDASHVIVRTGQALDAIIGRMTITQIDDDLVTIERGSKPAPPPPVAETELDIYIKILGFHNAAHQGNDISNLSAASRFSNEINEQPGYLTHHLPIKLLWFIGGQQHSANKFIVEQVRELNRKNKIGKVFLAGGSAGGKNVLQVAPELVGMNVPIEYVGLWDAALQREDLVDPSQFDNDANFNRFKPATLNFKGVAGLAARKFAECYFQSWGHCFDKNQEIHGSVQGFQPVDLTNDPQIEVIKFNFESKFLKLNSDKQQALEDSHVAAFARGEFASDAAVRAFTRLPLRPHR